ncbi:hypothetical protein [Clostridium sp. LIBA-8841]|uniref:hypothetical protein n=1 Tax=Clostridium sp. LIBA-8841 TaxID=2987530 RepID=UPI002AC6604F|nr:hypothetical protein [Clostridium sp. LIBA-8841]MDZ5253617.1 hypothetical protein [Clostridium sp. LIBA-8841]
MENFKSFLKKQKGFIIIAALSVALGYSSFSNPAPEVINSLKVEETTVLSNLESSKEEFSLLNEDISKLQTEVEFLKNENLEKEQILKETTAKIEKQNQEEAERLAKEEAERKKQEETDRLAKEEAKKVRQVSSNNSNNNSNSSTSGSSSNSSGSKEVTKPVSNMVYVTATGKKYHSKQKCGNSNPATTNAVPLSDAQSRGLTACKNCY